MGPPLAPNSTSVNVSTEPNGAIASSTPQLASSPRSPDQEATHDVLPAALDSKAILGEQGLRDCAYDCQNDDASCQNCAAEKPIEFTSKGSDVDETASSISICDIEDDGGDDDDCSRQASKHPSPAITSEGESDDHDLMLPIRAYKQHAPEQNFVGSRNEEATDDDAWTARMEEFVTSREDDDDDMPPLVSFCEPASSSEGEDSELEAESSDSPPSDGSDDDSPRLSTSCRQAMSEAKMPTIWEEPSSLLTA